MSNPTRTSISALVLSAATLVGIALSEGYEPSAMIPIPGDRPTQGFGSTFNPDGSPVKLGQKTTPVRALIQLLANADKVSQGVKGCIKVPLYPHELSAYTQLAYNIGVGAFCKSTIVKRVNALDYTGGCQAILMWDKAGGKTIKGLTVRRQSEYKQCLG